MAEKRATHQRARDAAQERMLQTARSARERGREIRCAALDMPWARCAPARLRALPRAWRQRTAVAAAADYFYRKRWLAASVSLMFSTVPISRRGGGMEQGAADHLHRL